MSQIEKKSEGEQSGLNLRKSAWELQYIFIYRYRDAEQRRRACSVPVDSDSVAVSLEHFRSLPLDRAHVRFLLHCNSSDDLERSRSGVLCPRLSPPDALAHGAGHVRGLSWRVVLLCPCSSNCCMALVSTDMAVLSTV